MSDPSSSIGPLERFQVASIHDVFNDLVLGSVAFDEPHGKWTSPSKSMAAKFAGVSFPQIRTNRSLTRDSMKFVEIRACLVWIQGNEPAIRQHIVTRMFPGWRDGWYDSEIDTVKTPEQFRQTIRLCSLDVLEDRTATAYYDDGLTARLTARMRYSRPSRWCRR